MNKTGIEWVRNPDGSQGYTLNDKTGCLNCTPEGLCLGGGFPCYAFKLANGRLRVRYTDSGATPAPLKLTHDERELGLIHTDPFYPRWWHKRLEAPYKIKKPIGIFLDDMSDWMGDYWPEDWTMHEILMMKANPQHRIYTLTKQPQNLPKFSPFPSNCFVGVTATNQDMYGNALVSLAKIDCKVRFISFEPLLEQIKVGDGIKYIDWVIIGAQTKPTVYPKIEWVEEIVKACDKAGAKVFLKNNLLPMFQAEWSKEYDKEIWAGERLRQEMPK